MFIEGPLFDLSGKTPLLFAKGGENRAAASGRLRAESSVPCAPCFSWRSQACLARSTRGGRYARLPPALAVRPLLHAQRKAQATAQGWGVLWHPGF